MIDNKIKTKWLDFNFGKNFHSEIELIFETPKEEVKKISKIIIDEMSGVTNSELHSFSIPLTVDLNTGDNWGELH